MRILLIPLLSIPLLSLTASAQPARDPFTINIATDKERTEALGHGGEEDQEISPSVTEVSGSEGEEEALGEESLQVDIVVDEKLDDIEPNDKHPQAGETGEEKSQPAGGTSGCGAEMDSSAGEVGTEIGAETSAAEVEAAEVVEAVEEEENGADVIEEDEGAEDGWNTVQIPQIGGAIKIPSGWHRPTAEQVLKSLEFIKFPSDDDKAAAEMGALAIGRMSLLLTKYPEPMEGLNPGVSITWEPMPMVFEQVPLEARSEGLARVLSTVVVPELKTKDEGFQLLEGPKAINDEGGGAWITFKGTTPLKSGGFNESIVRLYILPARDHILTVQIEAPADRESGEEVLPELWAVFESLSYAK